MGHMYCTTGESGGVSVANGITCRRLGSCARLGGGGHTSVQESPLKSVPHPHAYFPPTPVTYLLILSYDKENPLPKVLEGGKKRQKEDEKVRWEARGERN
jgi:hypothetical protein